MGEIIFSEGRKYNFVSMDTDYTIQSGEDLIYISDGVLTILESSKSRLKQVLIVKNIGDSRVKLLAQGVDGYENPDTVNGLPFYFLEAGIVVSLQWSNSGWTIRRIRDTFQFVEFETKIIDNIRPKKFPNRELVNTPDGNSVLRYFVSPDGDDDNNGLTWSKAKRQIQGVIDVLPLDLETYTVYIIVEGGAYTKILSENIRNGGIIFVYAGEWLEDTNVWAVWAKNDSTKTFTDTNAIVVSTTDTSSACKLNSFVSTLKIEFLSGHIGYRGVFWTSDYAGRFGAWEFNAENGTPWSVVQWYGTGVINLWIDGFVIKLGGATAFGLDCNSDISIIGSVQLVGGSGVASIGTGGYKGGVHVYSQSSYQDFAIGSFDWKAGYPRPGNSDFHVTDVKQAVDCTGSLSPFTRLFPSSGMIYVDDIQSYGTTLIRLSPDWEGTVYYDVNYATLSGTIGKMKLIETSLGVTKIYLTADLYDNGTNLYYKESIVQTV